jgi:lipid A 3-O-deacylase
MKAGKTHFLLICLAFASISSSALAQSTAQPSDDDAAGLKRADWNVAVFAGGGSGVGQRSNVQMFRAGARVGRVMTEELGHGWRRGTFELAAEITPVDYVFWSGYQNVYGFGITPLDMKWNFTSGRRIVPFVEAAAGVLWTQVNIPPGDTSQINFTPGGGGGMHIFLKPNRAITWTVRGVHISSASLGNHNPGVNGSVQVSLGYTWFKIK